MRPLANGEHSFLQPKQVAIDDFVAQSNYMIKRTVWTEACSSWYKVNSVANRVSALWPGSTLHYLEALSQPRADDRDVTYSGNRFGWMGNGYNQIEMMFRLDCRSSFNRLKPADEIPNRTVAWDLLCNHGEQQTPRRAFLRTLQSPD